MTNKNKPEIRFSGFTEEWEQRKLGDITRSAFQGINTASDKVKYSETGTPILQSKHITSGKISFEDIRYIDKEQYSNYFPRYVPLTNDILFANIGTIGPSTVVTNENEFLVAWNILKITLSNPKMAKFVQLQLEKLNQKHYFELVITGNATKFVNKDEMLRTPLLVPSIEEQESIGMLFSILQNTLDLHQRELELLKETKKGFLQKMFPKEGEKVPEIRFPGFTEEWKQRKFSEVIKSIQTGTNLLGSTDGTGTPLLKMGNIQRGHWSLSKLEFLDEKKTIEEENIARYGDFLFNTRNTLDLVGKGATWFGESDKYAFNSNIARFKFVGIDTIFFNYLYNTEKLIRQVKARAVGTTSVAAVYPRDLNSLEFSLPTIEEQQKIGTFFKQLDDTIALHQRELDLLKETKKGFLQKLFV
ncbi:restriction endonuclease subunit S [Enterococcus entomosocium]|uniref:restriction endonuclease subunit S n=1 Tax=Enterococcus entomosocium TaxID=3034352 RepID=UPI003BC75A7F